MKTGPRSLFGSKRPRIFTEPKSKNGKSFSFRRKQRVKFRSRYAGSVAKKWSKTALHTTLASAALGAAMWGSTAAAHIWKTSESLRVKDIFFVGDIPDRLQATFPVKTNDHFLKINPSELERDALEKYPELETYSIRRRLDRTLIVSGKFRTPIAFTHAQGEELAIDRSGILFHASGDTLEARATLPWVETISIEDRKLLLTYLSTWKKETPAFYYLVKKIETDRMRELNVELSDGVLVRWGPLDEADILNRAKRILRFRELFSPVKSPAELLFVTSDRIVMNKNWQKGSVHVEARNFSGN